MSVPAIMAPMYEWKGFDPAAAALGATVYGLFSMTSRFLWGWVADKVHIAALAVGVGLFNAVTFPLLIVLSDGSAYVYAAMVGVGVSGLVVVQSLVWPFLLLWPPAPGRHRRRQPALPGGHERQRRHLHAPHLSTQRAATAYR